MIVRVNKCDISISDKFINLSDVTITYSLPIPYLYSMGIMYTHQIKDTDEIEQELCSVLSYFTSFVN